MNRGHCKLEVLALTQQNLLLILLVISIYIGVELQTSMKVDVSCCRCCNISSDVQN